MQPLVSIMIPNYNHSRYLDECIQSAINQNYKNIEIILIDNCSTDESLKVASKYLDDTRFSICKNYMNTLNSSYRILSERLVQGKYAILLCADDYLLPTFIEKAVKIMEKYPNVGYVHGEKDFVTDTGRIIDWDPFYRCSFVAPGKNAMPIYMMTTVAHPAQALFRMSTFRECEGYKKEFEHMNADRTLWFYMSYYGDAAYIREKMCRIRVGEATETFITQQNLQHPILCHLTIKGFVEFGRLHGLKEVCEREEKATNRLANEFMGYAASMLSISDFEKAYVYLNYAHTVNRAIISDEGYRSLLNMIETKTVDMEKLNPYKTSIENKKHNYDPPADYVEIDMEDL